MRLKNFELAIEAYSTTAPDAIVTKQTDIKGIQKNEGAGFFSLRATSHEDYDQGFFNITQIKNVNFVDGKLTYSGSLSSKTENKATEIIGYSLAITKIE